MQGRIALRLLLVPSAYYPHVGGIEEATRQLASHLRRRGHAAAILTNRWPAGTQADEELDGVRVRRIDMRLPGASVPSLLRFGLAAPVATTEILRFVRRFRPDVVHVLGAGPNAAYFSALQRLTGCPLVLTTQGEFRADAHRSFERSLALRRGLGLALRRSAAVTACSRFVLDELAAGYAVPPTAEVIPNGVDPDDFTTPRAAATYGRYVFAAGRLVAQKAFDVLIPAFASAGDALGSTNLVIAGDGPERARLEQLAGACRSEGSVIFAGSVSRPRLAELMRGADMFAFPSRYEAFGIALLEAMAAGTPAVAARAGGIPEFARDGENALLVPPDDADALAAALVRLARDEGLRASLADGGYRTASQLTWQTIASRYEDLYRRVIDAG